MNFGKAKKILIFLFAFLNLFLIFQLYLNSGSKTNISKESIQKTISLVSSRGLEVSEDVVPKKIEVLSFLELSNPLFDEQFVSEFYSYENIETNETLKLSFKETEIKNEKELLKFLNKAGFSSYSLVLNSKITNPINGESTYFYQQSYNNHLIYGSSMNAVLKKNSVFLAEGNVYKIDNVKINDYTPVSPLQILLSISRSLDGNKAKVNEIKQGYYIPSESINYKNLTAVPCYIFTLNDNKFLFDAEKGEFLMCLTSDNAQIYDLSIAFSSL